MSGYTEAQLDRATKAVWEVTGGSLPWGKQKRGKKPKVYVSCRLVAMRALDAATAAVVTEPLVAPEQSHTKEGKA